MTEYDIKDMIMCHQKEINDGVDFNEIKKIYENLPISEAWPVTFKSGKILNVSPVFNKANIVPVATIATSDNFIICEDISNVMFALAMHTNLIGRQVDIIEVEDINVKLINVHIPQPGGKL